MISFPNCKINIGLHITAKRNDGYHNIETIMTPVQWCDGLEIVINSDTASELEFKSSGIRFNSDKENNLCIKAYKLLAERFSLPPVKFHLHKIIPIGAGLGGGSSDSAFVLMMLNDLLNLKLTSIELEYFAAQLGSDCPFFIHNKTLFCYERGDKFEKVHLKEKEYFIVLVKPKIHVNTIQAYSWITPIEREQSIKKLFEQPIEEWKSTIFNDFEPPVFERHPTIKNIKARLYKQGALYASMSGSGSTVFGIFNEEKHLTPYFRSATVFEGKIKL